MLTWEIFGEDLLWLEIYAGLALIGVSAVWFLFHRVPAALIALILIEGLLAVGSFRGFNYNSDTGNYYSYVYYLSFVNDNEIFFLTKLEPLHSGLIFLLRDFRLWLFAETAIMMAGLFLSYKARRNDFSFLILCAFVVTLSTSSLRFCSALIYFFYFMSRSEVDLFKAARMTVILSCFHISMLLSGALALRRRLVLIGLSAVCIVIFLESSLLGSRVELDLTEASRGIKTLGVAVIAAIYLFIRAPRYGVRIMPFYLLAFISIFVVSTQILPVFNRFLIMGTLVVLATEWAAARPNDKGDIFDRGFTVMLAASVVIPHVINLPRLFFSGTW